jgi:hypothetical protein
LNAPEEPPPPIATTLTEFTPAGAYQVYVPPEVYSACPAGELVVIELLEAPEPVPAELTAYTVNVYDVAALNPLMLAEVLPLVVDPPDQVIL